LITDLIPTLGFEVKRDVQVLSPMTRGAVGTRHLNQVMTYSGGGSNRLLSASML
jgi:hypothetical protein